MSRPGQTLVCFAVKEERQFFRSSAAAKNVRIVLTGIGWENAQAALERAFAEGPRPAFVFSAGFAGGLAPLLQSGDIVYQAAPGSLLSERLAAQGGKAAVFLCAEHIITTAAEKRRLRETTGADAVEMESECIRQFCLKACVPSATVRVILDTANEDLPLDFNRVSKADGRVAPLRVALALAQSPGTLGRLLRLRKQSIECARRLADVLERVLL